MAYTIESITERANISHPWQNKRKASLLKSSSQVSPNILTKKTFVSAEQRKDLESFETKEDLFANLGI